MSPTLRNARWFADVRQEAKAAGVALPEIYGMDNAIRQAVQELTQTQRLSIDDGQATRWQLGLEDTTPAVGEPVRRFIVASWQLNDGGARLDPFLAYAQGIEQQLARVRGDQIRALNPTPRRNYEDTPAAAPAPAGVAVLVGLVLVGILASRRPRK